MPIIPHKLQNIWVNRLTGMGLIAFILIIMVASKPPSPCSAGSYMHINGIYGNVDGLKKLTPVMLAGVPVGVVCQMQYINETKRVKVDMAIDKKLAIPDDSAMVILSEGFGGAKYVKISLGGSPTNFAQNDTFQYGQDAILFDVLLNKIITLAEQNNLSKGQKGEQKP